jgi:hypothetical protein
MSMSKAKFKLVWGAAERRGKSVWTRIGYAWEGRDGALLARLSAFPLSGTICVKDGYDEALETALSVDADVLEIEEAMQ